MNNSIQRLYGGCLRIILVFQILRTYSLPLSNLSNSRLIDYVTVGGLVLIYIMYDLLQQEIHLNDVLMVGFLFVLLVIIPKNQVMLILVTAMSYIHVTPNETIKIYRDGATWAIVVSAVLSFITHQYRALTGTIAFGFVNENAIGFLVAMCAILYMFDYHGPYLKLKYTPYNICAFVGAVLLNNFLFGDRTALLVVAVFIILILSRQLLLKSKLIGIVIMALPTFFAYSTYWLVRHFNVYPWVSTVNHLLTDRINIWNYYFSHMPLSWISNNKIFVISAWTSDYTPHQGLFDGGYAYALYIYGVFFTIIIVLGLTICNYRLIKTQNKELLMLMICMEVAGFTENTLISYAMTFTIIFALLAYHRTWLSQNLLKRQLENNG